MERMGSFSENEYMTKSYSKKAPSKKHKEVCLIEPAPINHGLILSLQVCVAAGAVPVKIDFPTLGTEIKFEKLLVTNEAQHIAIPFKKAGTCSCLCC